MYSVFWRLRCVQYSILLGEIQMYTFEVVFILVHSSHTVTKIFQVLLLKHLDKLAKQNKGKQKWKKENEKEKCECSHTVTNNEKCKHWHTVTTSLLSV